MNPLENLCISPEVHGHFENYCPQVMEFRLQIVSHWWVTKLRGFDQQFLKIRIKWKIKEHIIFDEVKYGCTKFFVLITYICVWIELWYKIYFLLWVVIKEVWKPLFLGFTEFSPGLEMLTDSSMGWEFFFLLAHRRAAAVLFCSFIG